MMSFISLQGLSNGLFLSMVAGIPILASIKKIDVFNAFIEGAKEGIPVVLRIIPYLVAMIVAIGMFRASGALTLLGNFLSPVLVAIGLPADILPLILIRPFSGSGANGMMAEIIHQHGGDAYVSQLAATIMGCTETTFYVVAVYFGAVGIRRTRYAIAAGLTADVVGVIASLMVCQWLFL